MHESTKHHAAEMATSFLLVACLVLSGLIGVQVGMKQNPERHAVVIEIDPAEHLDWHWEGTDYLGAGYYGTLISFLDPVWQRSDTLYVTRGLPVIAYPMPEVRP